MAINLTGKYQDGSSAREYVVMQDDVQRTDRNASIAFLRVMRQRDEHVDSGNLYVSDETFAQAGADDHARNAALAASLVRWIAERPVAEPHFQLRATLDAANPSAPVAILNEAYGLANP